MTRPPPSPILSQSQLATLALHGQERSAAVGDVLFRVGDVRYPFIAILEGEAAILDAAGHEIVRHNASGFLGEMNLLSGQTVFQRALEFSGGNLKDDVAIVAVKALPADR